MTANTTRRLQKNLTVMFTDISGFTQHTEMISRDALMKRLETHNELLMPIVAHFDGKIVKTIGDAFLITFESPTNAVQCGLFMQHTLTKFNAGKATGEQIHIKVSINSGEVTVTESDVFGDPVNVAAKIEKATNPDEIYFTEAVFLAMNKSEVPTSFVKSFRPKGAESQEIKLYKVAMDEGDERYQKVVQGTKIDPEKVKGRVAELTNLAEKEFNRYQDTLEALVESQGKSSRNMILAVLAAVIILGIIIVVAVSQFSGQGAKTDPGDQLTTSVRQYLANNKPAEARQAIDAYMKEHGADKTTEELLAEIKGLEVNEVAAEARRLIAKGEPENARDAVAKYFGSRPAEGEAAKALAQAEAYIAARGLMQKGKADELLKQLNDAFGDTNPSPEISRLRDQADALSRGRALMKGTDLFKNAALMIGTIEKAFGADVNIDAALDVLEEGVANEVFRVARESGYDRGYEETEKFRKQFKHIRNWQWIEVSMYMGYYFHVATNRKRDQEAYKQQYWDRMTAIREYIKGKPELMYRWGTLQFIADRAQRIIVASGVDMWRQALEADPSLEARHSEFWKIYEVPSMTYFEECGKSLRNAIEYSLGLSMGPMDDVRALAKTKFYKDLKPTLVKFANNKQDDNEFDTERGNSFAILAEMGDIELVEDRFWLFRKTFEDYMGGSTPDRAHMKALFAAPMTMDDYKEYRAIIDSNLKDVQAKTGRWSVYSNAAEKLTALLEDIRATQPAHTADFGG